MNYELRVGCTLAATHFDNRLLPWLRHRDLSYNEFSGPVPPTIGDLEHLLELYVGINLLEFLLYIYAYCSLMYTTVHAGIWVKTISLDLCLLNLETWEVSKWCKLASFALVYSSNRAAIRFIWTVLRMYSDMSSNNLSGYLPEELGQLQNLDSL